MSKLGDIYRAAALLVEQEREEFSCNAVDRAAGVGIMWHSAARRTYEETLAPEVPVNGTCWLWTTDFHPVPQTDETLPAARDHRVVALCLMAAMADAGDL